MAADVEKNTTVRSARSGTLELHRPPIPNRKRSVEVDGTKMVDRLTPLRGVVGASTTADARAPLYQRQFCFRVGRRAANEECTTAFAYHGCAEDVAPKAMPDELHQAGGVSRIGVNEDDGIHRARRHCRVTRLVLMDRPEGSVDEDVAPVPLHNEERRRA